MMRLSVLLLSCVMGVMGVPGVPGVPGVGAAVAQEAQETEDLAWEALAELAERAGPIDTYRADFVQEKFTPLLRDPIESAGQVRMAGGISRWDTREPYPSTMLIRAGELRMYYPRQQTLEVYHLGDRLDAMAASPVPDLAELRRHFAIETFHETDAEGDPEEAALYVSLRPRTEEMREAIESVEVELDARRATLRKLTITDVDGETTALTFSGAEINPQLDAAALELEVPEGTRVVHPLEGAGE